MNARWTMTFRFLDASDSRAVKRRERRAGGRARRSFLESVPEVAAKLAEPNAKEKRFEDVVKSAEQAAVLILVY